MSDGSTTTKAFTLTLSGPAPKTFVPLANAADASGSSLKRPKVFWFFFSKKELLSRADLI
jgi:hypothetical protein